MPSRAYGVYSRKHLQLRSRPGGKASGVNTRPARSPCPTGPTHEREDNMNSLRTGLAALGGVALATALVESALAQAPLPQPSAAHPWIQGAPFPDPSEEVLGATAAGKLYAFGGFAYPGSGPPGWTPVNNVFEYDPAADAWKELAPMPTKRGAASAVVANGKIYVTGGVNSLPGVTENGVHPTRAQNVVETVEEYDPASNSWKSLRPMLVARNHHLALGADGRVYVIGGRIGSGFISSASNNIDLVEMYDPATDMWTPRTRMPSARSAIAGGLYNGTHLLVAGGEGQDARFLAAFKAVEAYDTALNQWQILPSMPHARHGLAAGVIGNRFYAVSGDGQSAGNGIEHSAVAFNEILQLDLVLK